MSISKEPLLHLIVNEFLRNPHHLTWLGFWAWWCLSCLFAPRWFSAVISDFRCLYFLPLLKGGNVFHMAALLGMWDMDTCIHHVHCERGLAAYFDRDQCTDTFHKIFIVPVSVTARQLLFLALLWRHTWSDRIQAPFRGSRSQTAATLPMICK